MSRCLASTVQSETVCRLLTSLPEAEMVVETWEVKRKEKKRRGPYLPDTGAMLTAGRKCALKAREKANHKA